MLLLRTLVRGSRVHSGIYHHEVFSDAFWDYFRDYLCDGKKYANTSLIVALKKGCPRANSNDHPLLSSIEKKIKLPEVTNKRNKELCRFYGG